MCVESVIVIPYWSKETLISPSLEYAVNSPCMEWSGAQSIRISQIIPFVWWICLLVEIWCHSLNNPFCLFSFHMQDLDEDYDEEDEEDEEQVKDEL